MEHTSTKEYPTADNGQQDSVIRRHVPMNTSMVVIGHLTNPFDLKGSFSVHFGLDDFSANGLTSKATSRGFNLSVDVGRARDSAIHFIVVRLADGLRMEGFAECPSGKRNYVSFTGHFSAPDRVDAVGRFDSWLHWDGTQGILSANWTAPRK
jgi:hypothetical protein